MNKRIWSLGLAAAAAVALVVIGIVLLTGNDTGAQLSPSSSLAQTPQNAAPAQAESGTLVISNISPGGDYDIYLVRSDGTGLKRLTAGPWNEEHASWSPDGTRIVYSASEPGWFGSESGIYVMNADSSGVPIWGGVTGWDPSWSPDGKQILYNRLSDSFGDILVMNADGSGRPSVVPLPFSPNKHATWAADGKIVFVRPRLTDPYPNGGDLYAVNPDGSGLERLTKGASMMWPSVSPDGSTIAAYATKTDRLITMPYGGDGPAVTLLARASHYFPNYGWPLAHWAPDGMKLVLGSSNEDESGGAGLFLVNADGSGLTRIPGVTQAIGPDWRPSPAPSASQGE